MTKQNTYICAACKGEFAYVSEEVTAAAHEEAKELFGADGHAPHMDIVCDDCFKAMQARYGKRFERDPK